MRVMVTGSSGFIGSHVCRRLAASGHAVVRFDIASGVSLFDRPAIERAIARVETVFHIAAQPDLTRILLPADGDAATDVNIVGTRNIASACAARRVPLVYVSTCCVYGDHAEAADEDLTIPKPVELYAFTKLAGEEIVRGYGANFGVQYTILRIATAYGPGMRPALGVHVFLDQAFGGADITVHGDGEQTRALTYVEDIADGIVSLLEHPEASGQIINLASEETISANQMAADIRRIANSTSRIVHIADRPNQIRHQHCSSDKARRLLGWQARTAWDEGLRKTVEWFAATRQSRAEDAMPIAAAR